MTLLADERPTSEPIDWRFYRTFGHTRGTHFELLTKSLRTPGALLASPTRHPQLPQTQFKYRRQGHRISGLSAGTPPDTELLQMTTTRVLIVDSDQRFWDIAQFELAVDPRIEQITRIDSAQLALAELGRLSFGNNGDSGKIGIAIVNMSVPGAATTDLVRALCCGVEPIPVIALFDTLDDGRVGYAVGAGARACIAKTSPARQIRGTVIETLAGELPIHRDVAERPYLLTGLINEFQRQSRGTVEVETSTCPLTERELCILSLVADGNANKQIANLLFISERTVKNHMTNILAKLGARDRAHAVRFGIENSWLDLERSEPALSMVA